MSGLGRSAGLGAVAAVAGVSRARLGRQQVQHHRRDERPREEVAGEHREHDDIARGANRNPPTPPRNRIGHEHDADRQRRDERWRRHLRRAVEDGLPSGLPRSMWRWLFSISTVASSTRMPTASAIPPSVITLSVWSQDVSTMMEARIDSGIDVTTISVLRQDPGRAGIISPVRQPRSRPS
jgi:hypothetical protein